MNFSSFQTQILMDAEEKGKEWVYRGQACPEWELITSYSRFHSKAFGPAAAFDLEHFSHMLRRFILEASVYAGESYKDYSLFQKMALAQHHGIPTPMLDWTHSPYAAAYFGVSDAVWAHKQEVTFCIYAIDISPLANRMISQTAQEDILSKRDETFLFIDNDYFFSRRIARQAGCFTYQNFRECLKQKKIIPIKTYEVSGVRAQIVRSLELMGITGGNLFDDLDYIARDVVQAEVLRLQKPF